MSDLAEITTWLRREIETDKLHLMSMSSGMGWYAKQADADCDAKLAVIDLCEYLMGWTDEHDREVTPHEIESVRTAGQRVLLALAPGYQHRDGWKGEWRP